MSLADQFNQAMVLWFELTGFDPNAESFSMNSWHIRDMNEEIKKALTLDPSLITSFLLLDAYSESYLKGRTVSIDELDHSPERTLEYLTKVKEFRALIRSPELVGIGIQFQQQMERAMSHYKVPHEAVAKLIENKHSLAFLRRDALKSMDHLRVNQFLAGEYDPDEVTPVYNPTVFSYWNMNSCIEHLCHMPSGISLNLIRDPDELHSYFCFTVRNGGNLIVLSDVPEYAHPLGRYMSRRPDRAYDNRVSKNWFPYDLLAIEYDDEGNAYHDKYREAKDKGLVPHNPKHFTLKQISELEPPVIAWTLMMFDLIKDRYWMDKPQPLALSYTAEMIRLDQNRLLGSAANANLPVIGYQPLALAPLTIDDIKTDKLDKAAIGKSAATTDNKNFGHNQWLEDRYGNKVTEEVLNLLGGGDDRVRFITAGDRPVKEDVFGNGKSLVVQGSIQSMTAEEYESHRFFNRDVALYQMNAVDGTTFGTREQIDADRKFIARLNYVKGIQREADAEYKARRGEIIGWVADRYRENIDELLRFCTVDKFEAIVVGRHGFDMKPSKLRYTLAATSPYHYKRSESDERFYDFGRLSAAIVNFPQPQSWEEPRCYLDDVRAYWFTAIRPRNAESLAFLCGVGVDDLPDVIRHWRNRDDDPYTGNSILNRIDPLEWAVHDPWQKEDFMLKIFLSKRARTRLQKELSPPEPMATGEEQRVPTVVRM